MIKYEKIASLENIENELKRDCVIHSNVITGNKYITNLNSNYKNCIGTIGAMQNSFRYKSIDLLNECSNFGKKLFDLYKYEFQLYKPNYFIDENNKKVEFVSLYYKDFPNIKNNKTQELISIFIEWVKQYGFPITPSIVGINEDIIIEFKDIIKLRNSFIILYLLHNFYYNVSSICNTFSIDILSEQKRYSLHATIKNINTIGNILFDDFLNLDNSFVETNDMEKIDYNEKIKKALTYKINYYSNIFKTNVSKYIIYNVEECSDTYISNNLFDLAWNIFLETFKLSKKLSNTKICEKCGFSYTPTGNNSKICNNCKLNYNADKESKNKKFSTINYIIKKSQNFKSNNKDLQQRIDEIVTLNDKGNSKKRDTYSKKIIDKTRQELDEELNLSLL